MKRKKTYSSKLFRQAEILNLHIVNTWGNNRNYHKSYTAGDLANRFKVSQITVYRDLQDLRSRGINIHLKRNEVRIIGVITLDMILHALQMSKSLLQLLLRLYMKFEREEAVDGQTQ